MPFWHLTSRQCFLGERWSCVQSRTESGGPKIERIQVISWILVGKYVAFYTHNFKVSQSAPFPVVVRQGKLGLFSSSSSGLQQEDILVKTEKKASMQIAGAIYTSYERRSEFTFSNFIFEQ